MTTAAALLASELLEAPPVDRSPAMAELLRSLQDVAATPTTVLLLGSRGSGRARLARHLHQRSGRTGACLEIRCAAGTEAVLSTLAPSFAAAAGGTVILREVDRLAAPAQTVLLQALADRPAAPASTARVVATAAPDLGARALAGGFRSDLFFRLNVFPAQVPSLADRADDLEALATSILEESARGGTAVRGLSADALDALRTRPPATVAELADLLRRAGGGSGPIGVAELFGGAPAPRLVFPDSLPLDLEQLERLAIEEALRRARGNRTHAARLLHIGLRTLRNKLRAWRIAGEEVPPAPTPGARQGPPAQAAPGADPTAASAAILAPAWARRSQERSA